jgi:DNA-directed RNA polymerase subunit RPC12/RpoP
MSLNQKKRITTILGAAGILVAVLGSGLSMIMVLLGLAIFFVSAFLDTRWRRCPHCGKKLNRYQMEFCSNCRKEIDLDARQGGKRE